MKPGYDKDPPAGVRSPGFIPEGPLRRDALACIVLGRDANADRVNQWLRARAGVPGYRGFAIGRTIWWEPAVAFRDGKATRTEAARRIAENYLAAIDAYRV